MLKLYVKCDCAEVKKMFNSFAYALDFYYYYLSVCKEHGTYYLIYLVDMDTEEIIKKSSPNMKW